MKVPLSWLREHLETEAPVEQLTATLNGIGLEVEGVEDRGAALAGFRIADLERQADLMAVAQADARKLLIEDPGLASPRGKAARILLWLMEQDRAIRLIEVG